jgi:hypothetical protein
MLCSCGGHLTVAAWTEKGYVPRSRDKEKSIREHWQNCGHEWDGYAKKEPFGEANY